MRIVFLQDDFPPESKGGAGNMAATLALELTHQGHEVTVIAATQRKEYAGAGQWEGVPVHRIYSDYHERWRAYRSLYNWSTVPQVRQLLRELKPDVVHVHNIHYHLSYYALILAKRYAKKVVLTAHDEMLFHYGKFYEYQETCSYKVHWRQLLRRFTKRYNPLRNVLIRRMVRGVSIVSLTHEHGRMLAKNGYPSAVVHNGIDPTGWPADGDVIRAFARKNELMDKKVIMFAGRISRLKGAEVAEQVIAYVRRVIPDTVLLVAGAAGASDSAHRYTGWLRPEEMRAAYGASDVVIFPSVYFDPFGLVNLEAMAAGKPVVATTHGGAKEVVADGETGYVVDPLDVEGFSGKVLALLEDKEKGHQMGARGRKRMLEYFTAKGMARAYTAIYTQKEN